MAAQWITTHPTVSLRTGAAAIPLGRSAVRRPQQRSAHPPPPPPPSAESPPSAAPPAQTNTTTTATQRRRRRRAMDGRPMRTVRALRRLRRWCGGAERRRRRSPPYVHTAVPPYTYICHEYRYAYSDLLQLYPYIACTIHVHVARAPMHTQLVGLCRTAMDYIATYIQVYMWLYPI